MKFFDWFSERILFGTLVFVGYGAIVVAGSTAADLQPAAAGIIHDGMLALGPLAGMVIQAVFKTDRTDKQTAASIASLSATVAAQAPSGPALDPQT